MDFPKLLLLFVFLLAMFSITLGLTIESNITKTIQKRASPSIYKYATFNDVEVAQIKQGIADACFLANTAYDFSQVKD